MLQMLCEDVIIAENHSKTHTFMLRPNIADKLSCIFTHHEKIDIGYIKNT